MKEIEWEAMEDSEWWDIIEAIGPRNIAMVFQIGHVSREHNENEEDRLEWVPDPEQTAFHARLLAASPKLFKALGYYLQQHRDDPPCPDSQMIYRCVCSCCSKARAAIALVEGKDHVNTVLVLEESMSIIPDPVTANLDELEELDAED